MNPSLFSPEGLAGVIFLILIGVTMIGAIIATCTKRLIRSVSGLAVCFVGVAGLYYFLNSPFVAMMELLIYVGAVCVTIAFAIMLAEPDEAKLARKMSGLSGGLAAVCGGAVSFALGYAAVNGQWMAPATQVNDGSLKMIGASLLTKYSMVFELISIVLLAAIIGSVALARAGRRGN
ncbi:MAG: NADH-quinone oxidoreductase subunit J [Proteobacteria bacterium]|nr:NADH-quinone oxidoreductase subunit J [Pseudomonadota bacterium]MBU0965798.1 NADH-quinone oxidoreductase subunit J [Pseudomonadota bacterium]